MKHTDSVKRVHRIGQPPFTQSQNTFQYDVEDATKDVLREAVRREGMNNYSNASVIEMRDYLRAHEVYSMVFRILKKSE